MPNINDLPHLIKLIDDDSPSVQLAVVKELDSFGPTLGNELMNLAAPPDALQLNYINELLNDYRRNCLMEDWKSWLGSEDYPDKLEDGFKLIADFQNGKYNPVKMGELLDELAADFKENNSKPDVLKLAKFLFEEKLFKGDEKNYYNYRNSDLIYVIENRKGIPLSLAAVYMLTGKRLGLKIEGCNYPGHFLCKVVHKGDIFLIDCYYGGKILSAIEFQKMYYEKKVDISGLIDNSPKPAMILSRVLLNLNKAYQNIKDLRNSEFMLELLKELNDDNDDSLN